MIDRFTPSAEEAKNGMMCKSAVQCGICGSHADRFVTHFQCQLHPGHIADLNTVTFFDLTYPTECIHEYVNISFNRIIMACKHCGKNKE
jgi:hypothetical protein